MMEKGYASERLGPPENDFSCIKCGHYLGLNASRLFHSKEYFPAGNKGTLSFQVADERCFVQKQESKCGPFFETADSWGIQRTRTALFCAQCNSKIGYIYHDGPSVENTIGQFGMGPSQVLPRMQRYRIKKKAVIPTQDVPAHPEYQQGFQKEVDMPKSIAK
ncbi:hypothetical protein KFL_005330070 [Klebsormidium nitens]|uniref:Uncharacterized protein n=1 Tax=Klebsormidium nitens TaxID=105231 RepID=A0A1Y1IHI4_KLENI|nr:hypothetical protein KFL_005330070 [Klebsormidium nitens]|eukprot:GAQ89532.1 hypothetical protein KFL_005330070 [Klebsormidium nitens]